MMMGLINFGVPESKINFLIKKLGLNVFVEGGTYKGGTAKAMSTKFEKVYTIEKSLDMFDIAKENLISLSNVLMLKGDTREHLQSILENNDDILFWLDAHWSGGKTYGEEDECPLIEELEIIFSYNKNYIVLIDDARLFLAPPPKPHNFLNWPSLTDIIKLMPDNWDLIEFEDVIYLFPKSINIDFREYLQQGITEKWKKSNKEAAGSILSGLKISIRGLLNGNL